VAPCPREIASFQEPIEFGSGIRSRDSIEPSRGSGADRSGGCPDNDGCIGMYGV
jgi:hypothetical protein